jgi:hypothetical protein
MRPQVALPSILIALLLGAFALAGCGGGGADDASASKLMEQTFGNDAQLKSGRVGLALNADLKSGSVQASVDARFSQGESGQLPRLDGTLKLDSGDAGTIQAGAISLGDKGYITVGGQAFAVPGADWKTFTRGYLSDQQDSEKQRAAQPTLGSLGIHPDAWLVDPRKDGESEIAGDKTTHITAGVDVAKMLQDVSKVAKKTGAGAQISALGTGIKSAEVQIDTGVDDHRLRQLQIHMVLDTGTLDLRVTYSDLDQPQTITAPKDARPMSELTTALQQALGTGTGGGGTSTTPQGSGAGNAQYLACLQKAGDDVAKVQTCGKYL